MLHHNEWMMACFNDSSNQCYGEMHTAGVPSLYQSSVFDKGIGYAGSFQLLWKKLLRVIYIKALLKETV